MVLVDLFQLGRFCDSRGSLRTLLSAEVGVFRVGAALKIALQKINLIA